MIQQPNQKSRNKERAAFSHIIKGIDHICAAKTRVIDFLEEEMENVAERQGS